MDALLDEERKLDMCWESPCDGQVSVPTFAAGGRSGAGAIDAHHVFTTLQPWCIDLSPGLVGQTCRIVDVLRSLREALLIRSPDLSDLLHALHFPCAAVARQRDVFPLPLPPRVFMRPIPVSDSVCNVIMDYVDLIIVLLNRLAGVKVPVALPAPPQTPTLLWRATWSKLIGDVLTWTAWLAAEEPATFAVDCVWADLADDRETQFPSMDAAEIDTLNISGLVDPLPTMDPASRLTVSVPDRLFPNGAMGCLPRSRSTPGTMRSTVSLSSEAFVSVAYSLGLPLEPEGPYSVVANVEAQSSVHCGTAVTFLSGVAAPYTTATPHP